MVRVLHVLGKLDIGGAETFIMNVYRNIPRDEIQFDFVVHSSEKQFFEEEILSLGGRVFVCPQYNGFNHLIYCRWWSRFLEQHEEITIIHGHVRSTANIYLKIAKKHDKYTISHSHGMTSGKGIEGWVKRVFQRSIINIADYFFACSLESGKWLFGENITRSNRFEVLNNAISSPQYTFSRSRRDKIRNELNISEGTTLLGSVGRIVFEKNYFFAIDVFVEFNKLLPSSEYIIIGDGEEKDRVQAYARLKQIDAKIHFLGTKSNISDYLSSFDLFLLPSRFEGFGIAALEAQASGLPTLISSAFPPSIMITDLVTFCDLEASAQHWANLLITKLCSSEINRLNAWEIISRTDFEIKGIAIKLSEFYLEKNARK